MPSNIEEPEPEGAADVEEYVLDLAHRKCLAVTARLIEGVVLSADTACAIDGEILNKPLDRADADRMIRLQEGRKIEVWTGLAFCWIEQARWARIAEPSVVFVRRLTDRERAHYLDSGLWQGKAGGYGVQDDDPFVTLVSGSATNVVGLPMERVKSILDAWGVVPAPSG